MTNHPKNTAPAKRKGIKWREVGKTVLITGVVLLLLIAFLLPFLQMLFISTSTMDQITELGAPEWPAKATVFEYQGEEYNVYIVPFEGGSRNLALVKKGRKQSTFLDPKDPEAGEIEWEGSWRKLERPWSFAPTFQNYVETSIPSPKLALRRVGE